MTGRRTDNESGAQNKLAVLEEKIERIMAVLERIEARLEQIDERLRAAELAAVRGEASLSAALANMEGAHERLDEHQARLEELPSPASLHALAEKTAQMEAPVRALVWLGSVLGVSLLGFLWAIFTHQVILSVP